MWVSYEWVSWLIAQFHYLLSQLLHLNERQQKRFAPTNKTFRKTGIHVQAFSWEKKWNCHIQRCYSCSILLLTSRFHVAVRVLSNRSRMTSKCGKNNEVAHEPQARLCHLCFYHILTSSVIYYWTDPRQHAIYLFYTMIRKEKRPIHIPASYRLTGRGFALV